MPAQPSVASKLTLGKMDQEKWLMTILCNLCDSQFQTINLWMQFHIRWWSLLEDKLFFTQLSFVKDRNLKTRLLLYEIGLIPTLLRLVGIWVENMVAGVEPQRCHGQTEEIDIATVVEKLQHSKMWSAGVLVIYLGDCVIRQRSCEDPSLSNDIRSTILYILHSWIILCHGTNWVLIFLQILRCWCLTVVDHELSMVKHDSPRSTLLWSFRTL